MNALPIRHPVALRGIALFEVVKGALGLAAACGLLSLRHTDLHAATDAFLLRHGINPEGHYLRLGIESVARVTNHHAGLLVGLCLAYAVIRFAEGFGLWQGKSWAEWFAVLSAGLYLPLEIWRLIRHPSLFSVGLILFNLAIMFYLGKLLFQQRAAHSRRVPSSARLVPERQS